MVYPVFMTLVHSPLHGHEFCTPPQGASCEGRDRDARQALEALKWTELDDLDAAIARIEQSIPWTTADVAA